jgi:type 1 fimbriae regulatory protein FimB
LHYPGQTLIKHNLYGTAGTPKNHHKVAFQERTVHSPELDRNHIESAMQFLEPTEVLAVLRAAKAKNTREWAMMLVAYKHGMRASEVCNLRLDDLDMKNGNLIINRLKGSLRTTQAITEHRGEPLLNEQRALRDWLRRRHDDGSDYVFTSQKGGRIHRSQFFRLFRALAEGVGLPPHKCHPHALKHSLASHLVSANVNLALIKQQLGHKSIGSTMRYVVTSDRQASKATVNALMAIF